MGCMCMECAYARTVRDNHRNLFQICVCRESDNFLHQLDFVHDNCEIGIVEGYEDHPTEKDERVNGWLHSDIDDLIDMEYPTEKGGER